MFGVESPFTPAESGSTDALSWVKDWSEPYCDSIGVFARCIVVPFLMIETPAELEVMAVKAPPS